jgi:hypothetical protein
MSASTLIFASLMALIILVVALDWAFQRHG